MHSLLNYGKHGDAGDGSILATTPGSYRKILMPIPKRQCCFEQPFVVR